MSGAVAPCFSASDRNCQIPPAMKTRYVAEYRDVLDRLGLAQAEMGVSMRTAHGYANGVCIPEPVARFLALTLSLYKRGRFKIKYSS